MSTQPGQSSTSGIYLYGLSRAHCLPAVNGMVKQGVQGVDERYPVMTFEANDMVAVIGKVHIEDFSEKNLQILEWVGKRAFQHEAIVELVMQVATILPVKFGTIFRSLDSLNDFLAEHQASIVQVLDGLYDKSEWSVKGYLTQEQAEKMVCVTNPAIQTQVASMSASPGVRYLQERQLVGKIEVALRGWLDDATVTLKDALLVRAVDATDLRCHSAAVTGRTERMVFNCSFLVENSALDAFRAALCGLQLEYQETGLALELRGPWPPYNFCPALSEVQR